MKKKEEFPVTLLLRRVAQGDSTAENDLYNIVYDDLFRMARHRIFSSGSMTVLDSPGLVGEAYLRLQGKEEMLAGNRKVFFAYAAKVMRNIVLDHVKEANAEKRGGGITDVTLQTGIAGLNLRNTQIEGLEEALQRLNRIDKRASDIVELRYFGGLSMEECAEQLEISISTATRSWEKARVFLAAELLA